LITDITSPETARAFVGSLELWREHALGQKDYRRPSTAPAASAANDQAATLLQSFAKIHAAYRDGSLGDAIWQRAQSLLKTLMSMDSFRTYWETRQDEFPVDFREQVRAACGGTLRDR
jgi:hypothetical protein